MIDGPLQRDRAERVAVVEGDGREFGLDLTEDFECPPQVRVGLNHDSDGSLNVHHNVGITRGAGDGNWKGGSASPPTPEGRGTRRRTMFGGPIPLQGCLSILKDTPCIPPLKGVGFIAPPHPLFSITGWILFFVIYTYTKWSGR